MALIALRLSPGADLKQSLLAYCAERRLEAACIVTCVGSLQRAAIRFADRSEASVLEGKMEIVSLVGTLSRHGGHLHVSLADGSGRMTGGHLMDGSLVYTTAEIVLGLLPEVSFLRQFDAATGYKELVVADLHAPDPE